MKTTPPAHMPADIVLPLSLFFFKAPDANYGPSAYWTYLKSIPPKYLLFIYSCLFFFFILDISQVYTPTVSIFFLQSFYFFLVFFLTFPRQLLPATAYLAITILFFFHTSLALFSHCFKNDILMAIILIFQHFAPITDFAFFPGEQHVFSF